MGEQEGWQQPNGLMLNGLMPNESTWEVRALDVERWSKAEERIAELIACIQPNQPSEQRRNAVADYVQRLIMKCFPCQVFTFGSVPLKTYLPDGDIDLTAFSKNQALKDSWASQVRDILESEEKNENAEFRVKEVQYIQAEVKIIKCLVENIVVDISFNQLGGLCTLCFLEEVDHLINQNHLFKRSIILIKAWCYYESRILGAHHGLISTYALETLVLYIFHVFNNSFSGPLEVLYRFLEFFSKFDWNNFCVSLWGPVPITSLPDVTAEPPRKDRGELLLSKLFLDACSAVYAVLPIGQENQGQPFISKHFNVIDPLRVNNNLGRSVSKGNFYRIRSAFAFGAKRLARLLECPKEDITFELNQFFMNTWERHGSGIRPDAPINDTHLRLSDQEHTSDNHVKASTSNKTDENASIHEIEVEGPESTYSLQSTQHTSHPLEAVSRMQGQKISGIQINSSAENRNSNQSVQIDLSQKNWKPDHMDNLNGRYYFARTRSSPELTDAYCDASTRGRRKPSDNGKAQVGSSKIDGNRRRNMVSETVSTQSTVSSSDDPSSARHNSSHQQQLEVAGDAGSVANSYVDDSVSGAVNEDRASVMGAQGMHQEEQDLVNMMASSSVHNFSGPIPMPMNMGTTHLPLPMSQSVLASLGYAQRSMAGMVPANVPMLDPHWANNLQFHQGLMPPSLTQYFPRVGLSTSSEDSVDQCNENFGSVESTRQDTDSEYWHERDAASNGGFSLNEGSVDTPHADDRQPSNSNTVANFVSSFRMPVSGGAQKVSQKFTKESRGSTRADIVETFQHQDNRANEVYTDDRVSSARFSSASQSGSIRMKPSSENLWDGPSGRGSKAARDKRGRKPIGSSATPFNVYGKGKDIYEHTTAEADDESSEWNAGSTIGSEIDERSTSPQPASALYVSRHHFPGYEGSHTSAPDSLIPIAPMVLGPGSRQRAVDNSGGAVPFAFYPTGPPVPFFTMLHYYPPESGGTSDPSSSSHQGLEDGSCGQNFEASEGVGARDTYHSMSRETVTKLCEEPKRDILNSDFASHWQNLQYGRLCQTPRYPAPVICPSPVVVPPMYVQGHFPWDGPGRPVSAKVNILPQLMNYGPQIVPIAPLQSAPNRPTVYQQFPDELPRYRSGTGTYLPNPKASARDRYPSGTRRHNHYTERSDHSDREGNWNVAKSRAAARNHNRSQTDKSRFDRLPASENRADRHWAAHRHDQLPPYQAQNGPVRPSSSQTSSPNVAYGMYQMPDMTPSRVTSNGLGGPPVVMLYPYDHNSGYVSPGEQLEFGSLGPVGYVGPPDSSQSIDATRVRGEIQRFHGNSAQQSSPDQPSSPHFQRRI